MIAARDGAHFGHLVGESRKDCRGEGKRRRGNGRDHQEIPPESGYTPAEGFEARLGPLEPTHEGAILDGELDVGRAGADGS